MMDIPRPGAWAVIKWSYKTNRTIFEIDFSILAILLAGFLYCILFIHDVFVGFMAGWALGSQWYIWDKGARSQFISAHLDTKIIEELARIKNERIILENDTEATKSKPNKM